MDEAEILGGQQVFARRVRLEDMVLVAVEELPLALEGIVSSTSRTHSPSSSFTNIQSYFVD